MFDFLLASQNTDTGWRNQPEGKSKFEKYHEQVFSDDIQLFKCSTFYFMAAMEHSTEWLCSLFGQVIMYFSCNIVGLSSFANSIVPQKEKFARWIVEVCLGNKRSSWEVLNLTFNSYLGVSYTMVSTNICILYYII